MTPTERSVLRLAQLYRLRRRADLLAAAIHRYEMEEPDPNDFEEIERKVASAAEWLGAEVRRAEKSVLGQ